MNDKQRWAIQRQNEQRIKALCPEADNRSGIYMFYRPTYEVYIGKAERNLLRRMAQHLSGYQHIDNSIRKKGLYSEKNPNGYKVKILEHCPSALCDEREQFHIQQAIENKLILKNVESGGTNGKTLINEPRERKGYRKGVEYGYAKAKKEIAHWFELHLQYGVKKQGNKVQEKALKKFEEFIGKGEEK